MSDRRTSRRRPGPGLLGLALLALGGCAPEAADTGACDREPPLDYENFGQGWLDRHCAGCHSSYLTGDARFGAPVGVDLNTWGHALEWAERIDARTLGSADMPPGGGPTEDELMMLEEWLTCELLPAREAWLAQEADPEADQEAAQRGGGAE